MSIRSWARRVRHWLQPYYPLEKETAHEPTAAAKNKKYVPHVIDVHQPLSNVKGLRTLPSPGDIWCYHDANQHTVLANLPAGTSKTYRNRNNEARKQLQPLIKPIEHGMYDRTHLIPFGYHGSENDPRLLVGWDRGANQKQFNRFEMKQKRRQQNIYWLTVITRQPWGLRWEYKIFDANTRKKIDQMRHDFKTKYMWRK